MPTEIVIPNVGESVTSGIVSAWTKGDGDWVDRDDIVMELETDKITVEVPAPASGVLKHNASEGDEVDVGAVIGTIDESGEKPASSGASESKQASEGSSEAGSSSATATAAPPEPVSEPTSQPTSQPNGEPASVNGTDVKATPLARKVAQEHGINLSDVPGTGAGHRIREEDVLAFIESKGKAAPKGDGAPRVSVSSGERGTRRERMSPLRQRIATRLVDAQQTAAMLTTFNECDMTSVMALRKQYKDQFEKKHGIGLGFMSFFIKAVASALEAYPAVNAYIVDDDGQASVEYHDYADVAVAVSTPKGLVVPVLRDCQDRSMAEIELGIKDLAERARDGKLTLEEMQGGTFTITNGGVFGSLMSTPILNPPQSGILGMHTIKKRAVEDPDNPGQVALRPMMYLALSYDHRIVDGAGAVRFLVHIKDMIEEPTRLLLDV